MDRNFAGIVTAAQNVVSLSARRAWIEMFGGADCSEYLKVALRKESVDRNTLTVRNCSGADRRSPQGERG